MIDSSSVRVKERLTDNGAAVVDISLCEEVVVWLLSTYFKEGEEQKEVLEAKDDEEKESEVDGEVEERAT